MFDYRNYKILLCCGATDMRKSINGLSSIVCEQFELDPREKIIFAFKRNIIYSIIQTAIENNSFNI